MCGKMLAGIHASLDRRPPETRRCDLDLVYLLDHSLNLLSPSLENRHSDRDYLRRVAEQLKGQISELLPTTRPYYGLCHGDLGFIEGGNVHEDRDGNLSLLDFDFCGNGWRAYNISVFLWNRLLEHGWTKSGRGKVARRWRAFRDGYSTVRRLDDCELVGAGLFVPVRHIQAMGMRGHWFSDV